MSKPHLTSAQEQDLHDKLGQYAQTQEYKSLHGWDQRNAMNAFINAYVKQATGQDGGLPTNQGGGFFQPIPGQPGWETTATRVIGGVVGGLLGAEALGILGAGGGTAATTAGATATEGVADGGVTAATAGGGSAAAGGGGALTASQIINKALPVASNVLGGAAKSEQDQNNTRDKLLASLVGTQLNRDKFAVEAPGARMRSALQAALAKNYTPASVQWGGPGSGLKGQIPQYTGGVHSLEPALQDPSVKAMMDMVGPDMAAQEKRGGASGGNQDASLGLPSSFGSESTLDRILGGGALTSSALAQILPLLTGNRQQNTGTLGQTFPNGIPFDDQTQDPTDIWGGQVPE